MSSLFRNGLACASETDILVLIMLHVLEHTYTQTDCKKAKISTMNSNFSTEFTYN